MENLNSLIVGPGESKEIILPDEPNHTLTRIELLPGANVNFYIVGKNQLLKEQKIICHLHRDSQLNVFLVVVDENAKKYEVEANLDGKNAKLDVKGIVVVDKNQSCETCVTVNHHAPYCISNQLVKYVLDGDARGSFSGLIKVDHGAKKTEAYQTNRNILISSTARMNTEPQLEIYCDDVKCSHGAATGQLNELQLFYLRSRGIDLPQARAMLIDAFVSDIVDTIPSDNIKTAVKQLVRERLHHENLYFED